MEFVYQSSFVKSFLFISLSQCLDNENEHGEILIESDNYSALAIMKVSIFRLLKLDDLGLINYISKLKKHSTFY